MRISTLRVLIVKGNKLQVNDFLINWAADKFPIIDLIKGQEQDLVRIKIQNTPGKQWYLKSDKLDSSQNKKSNLLTISAIQHMSHYIAHTHAHSHFTFQNTEPTQQNTPSTQSKAQYTNQSTPGPEPINQTHLLQEYIHCLQKQNQTKNIERQTLYAELQKLQNSLHALHHQLTQAKSTHTAPLIHKIRDLEQQVAILKYEQQHLFEENLSLINNFQQTSHKLHDAEKENKQLKAHKEELDKFRIALQKITQNLQQIEIQKFALAQNNIVLSEENAYLKTILSQAHISQYNRQKLTKEQQNEKTYLRVTEADPAKDSPRQGLQVTSVSNYLMSNSFQKISEYQEQYEESNGNSVSRNQNTSRQQSSQKQDRVNDGTGEKSVQDWEESNQIIDRRESQDRSVRSIKYVQQNSIEKEDQNQSSYLIFDERSAESLSLSFEVIHSQRVSNKQAKMVNNEVGTDCLGQKLLGKELGQTDEQLRSDEEVKGEEKQEDESSNDVIQEMSEEQSFLLSNRTSQPKARPKQQESARQIQALKSQVTSLHQQLHQSQTLRKELQKKIIQIEKMQEKNISEMEQKIEQLLKNYESIVNYTQELEQDNVELYSRNDMLKEQKDQLERERKEIELMVRELDGEKKLLVEQRGQLMRGNHELLLENGEIKAQLQELQEYCAQAQQYINSVNTSRLDSPSSHNNFYNSLQLVSEADYLQLIRQNSQLIERVNQLQIERSSLCHRPSSDYSNQSSRKYLDSRRDKQNCMNNLNHNLNHHLSSPSLNQKFFRTHQTNQNHHNNSLSFRSQIQKQHSVNSRNSQVNHDPSNHSQSGQRKPSNPRQSMKEKLQKRIQSIKQENLSLLNQLEFY